jgi:hypothetical protein
MVYVEEGINEPNSIVTWLQPDDAVVGVVMKRSPLDERRGHGGASPEHISPCLASFDQRGSDQNQTKWMEGFDPRQSVYKGRFIDSKRQEKIKKRAVEVLWSEEIREEYREQKREGEHVTGIEGKEGC